MTRSGTVRGLDGDRVTVKISVDPLDGPLGRTEPEYIFIGTKDANGITGRNRSTDALTIAMLTPAAARKLAVMILKIAGHPPTSHRRAVLKRARRRLARRK